MDEARLAREDVDLRAMRSAFMAELEGGMASDGSERSAFRMST